MTDGTMLRDTYARPEAPARTPRAIEYDLFARNTGALQQAWARRREDFAGLAAALHANSRLWSVLAADVAEPGNALPAHLRAQIFYLCEFTLAHSARVLEGATGIDVLVDINTAIMRGLRGGGGSA